ncbi:MAG TPA: hypothetical protein VFA12_20495 [Stellaceae bacterium]|nr:hypothetical protein [Stellaceae bacterium]
MSVEPYRRFRENTAPPLGAAKALKDGHPAVVHARTLFPTTVVNAKEAPRLLVSGGNHRKLGDHITKGPWTGFPIFALTLEERATCPSSCHHWRSCFGNAMHWSRRLRHGQELVDGLSREMAMLQRQHPQGFAVRLHILGDFYAVEYVKAWRRWLDLYPALHVFGFTAWRPGTEIGDAVHDLVAAQPSRFAIRQSHTEPGVFRAVTIASTDDRSGEGFVCPAQTGETAYCGTCGACWAEGARDKTVFFLTHGLQAGRKPASTRTVKAQPSAPAIVPLLRAEFESLRAELRHDIRFQKYEALAKLLNLYRRTADDPEPPPAAAKRPEIRRFPAQPRPDNRLIRRRLVDGASNEEIAAEFGISRVQAQGYRIGYRQYLTKVRRHV